MFKYKKLFVVAGVIAISCVMWLVSACTQLEGRAVLNKQAKSGNLPIIVPNTTTEPPKLSKSTTIINSTPTQLSVPANTTTTEPPSAVASTPAATTPTPSVPSIVTTPATTTNTPFYDVDINSYTLNIDGMVNSLMSDIVGQLPGDIQLSDAQIEQLVTALQPAVSAALTNASGDIAGYLLGTQPDFNITVALAPALPTLETVTEEAFMAQLPADLQGLPQAYLDDAFTQYYAGFSQTMPATYAVNSSDLGLNGAGGIATDIANAQNSLNQARSNIAMASQDFNSNFATARTYVGYFNAAFMLLIALLALAILGIILILRNVKSACRILGVVFLLFGALEYAVVLIVKNVGPSVIARLNIQPALSNVPGIVLNDFMAPLQFVSLACLIAGGIIIVTSIVYPGVNPAKNAKGEIGPTAKESMVDSQL